MSATEDNAEQESTLFGHVHEVTTPSLLSPTTGPASGKELCSIDQHGRVNSGGANNSLNLQGPVCADQTLETTCTNTQVSEGPMPGCTKVNEGCLDCPQVDVVTIPLLPTYGQAITMPSFDEPASYVPFGS